MSRLRLILLGSATVIAGFVAFYGPFTEVQEVSADTAPKQSIVETQFATPVKPVAHPIAKKRAAKAKPSSEAKPDEVFMSLVQETFGKALLTAEEAASFKQLVDSRSFKKQIEQTLKEAQYQNFDFDREKNRLELISSLDRVHRYGNEATKTWYVSLLQDRIFAKGYLAKTDMKYRKSLAGDKLDYLRLLRQADPDRFQTVQEEIHASGDRLLLYLLGQV